MDKISEKGYRRAERAGLRAGVRGHILVMLLAGILSAMGDPEVQICCRRDLLNKQPTLPATSGRHLHPIPTNKHNARLANR